MADGAAQINPLKDLKEIDSLLGRKCLSSLAKIKIGPKRILEEIQERAVQLYPF